MALAARTRQRTYAQDILRHPDLEQHLRNEAPQHLAAHRPDLVARRYLEQFGPAAMLGTQAAHRSNS